MNVSRRGVLKAGAVLAGAGGLGYGGSRIAAQPLEIKLYQTAGVRLRSEMMKGDPHYAMLVAKDYIEHTYGNLLEDTDMFSGLQVRFSSDAQDIDTDYAPAIARLLEWEERVDGMSGTAQHANLLLDTAHLDVSAGGITMCPGCEALQCDMASDETSAGLINQAHYLTNLNRGDAADSHPVWRDGDFWIGQDIALARYVASAAVHEIGHMACLPHASGGSWAGEDVHDAMTSDSVRDDAVVTSVMMGPYADARGLGGKTNICGEYIEPLDLPERDWHLSYNFAPCAKERLVTALDRSRS